MTAPKCYYAEYQKVEDDFLFGFFSSEPSYDENTHLYYTDTEGGWNTENQYHRKGGYESFYNMGYFTKSGDDYYTAAFENFRNYPTTREFYFMTHEEVKADFLDKTKAVFPTELEINIYAIDAEGYLKEAQAYDSSQKLLHPNSSKEWSAADDFYYVRAYQLIDGIPGMQLRRYFRHKKGFAPTKFFL